MEGERLLSRESSSLAEGRCSVPGQVPNYERASLLAGKALVWKTRGSGEVIRPKGQSADSR